LIGQLSVIGVEAIRVFAPQFYSLMSSNKHLFTATESLYVGLSSRDDKQAREAKYEELIETVPQNIRDAIDGICKQLFPQLDFRTSYPHDWQQTWRREKRVCSEEKFSFYFSLSIPTGAVSEAEIKAVLKTIDNKENFLKTLKKFNEEKRLRKLLGRLMDYIDEIKQDDLKSFILGLWQLEEEVEDKRLGMWDLDNIDTLVSRLTYHSIKNKINEGTRGKFIKDLINECDSLYPPVKFARLVIHEFEEKHDKPNEKVLLEEKEVEELKSVIAAKFKDSSLKEKLRRNKNLAYLLFSWKEVSGEKEVQEFIADIIKDKDGLATFLAAFVSDVFSQGMGDYVSIRRRELNKKSIEALYPIKKIEEMVASITEEDLEKFTEEQKEAIELFRKPKESDIF